MDSDTVNLYRQLCACTVILATAHGAIDATQARRILDVLEGVATEKGQ